MWIAGLVCIAVSIIWGLVSDPLTRGGRKAKTVFVVILFFAGVGLMIKAFV